MLKLSQIRRHDNKVEFYRQVDRNDQPYSAHRGRIQSIKAYDGQHNELTILDNDILENEMFFGYMGMVLNVTPNRLINIHPTYVSSDSDHSYAYSAENEVDCNFYINYDSPVKFVKYDNIDNVYAYTYSGIYSGKDGFDIMNDSMHIESSDSLDSLHVDNITAYGIPLSSYGFVTIEDKDDSDIEGYKMGVTHFIYDDDQNIESLNIDKAHLDEIGHNNTLKIMGGRIQQDIIKPAYERYTLEEAKQIIMNIHISNTDTTQNVQNTNTNTNNELIIDDNTSGESGNETNDEVTNNTSGESGNETNTEIPDNNSEEPGNETNTEIPDNNSEEPGNETNDEVTDNPDDNPVDDPDDSELQPININNDEQLVS